MARPSNPAELISALRSAASPAARLRILFQGASLLRRLPRGQRRSLLARLGFEEAEVLVGKIADHEAQAALEQVLDEVEADPSGWRRLLGDLRDPRARRQAIRELGQRLDRALVEEVPEELDESEPETTPTGEEEVAEVEADEAEAALGSAVVAAGAGAATAVASPREADTSIAAAPDLDRALRPEDSEPEEPAMAGPIAPSTGPPPWLVAAPAEVSADEEEGVDAAETPGPSPVPQEEPFSEVVETKAAEALRGRGGELRARRAVSGPIAELADLRRRAAAGTDEAMLVELMEDRFPAGWPRRRALQALIEERSLSLAVALRLIKELPSRADRRWVLNSLAGCRPWTEAEWRELVGESESLAAARRLERCRR